jgi:hypothetical protein
MDVATPVIGRTPLGTSSMYTPGNVVLVGIVVMVRRTLECSVACGAQSFVARRPARIVTCASFPWPIPLRKRSTRGAAPSNAIEPPTSQHCHAIGTRGRLHLDLDSGHAGVGGVRNRKVGIWLVGAENGYRNPIVRGETQGVRNTGGWSTGNIRSKQDGDLFGHPNLLVSRVEPSRVWKQHRLEDGAARIRSRRSNPTRGAACGLAALIRLEPELTGTHYPTGGRAVQSGLDLDDDQELDDDEITGTTQYVCSGVSPVVTTSIKGSCTLRNSPDAALLASVTQITGDLVISAPKLVGLSLPSLTSSAVT